MARKNPAIPLEKDAIKLVADLKSKAEETRSDREQHFSEYMKFALDCEQWEKDELPKGKSPALSFNQTKDYIDVHVGKIFPINQSKGIVEIGVKSYAEKALKEKYEKEIFDTYFENNFIISVTEQLQNFFYGGAACLYYPQDPISKKTKIISIDPTKVFANWEGHQLSQFAFVDEISLAEAKTNKKNSWLQRLIKAALGEIGAHTDEFKKVQRITYWDKACQIVSFGEKYAKVAANESHFIPASWIPNEPKPHKHEGRSDVKQLKKLEKEYNFRTSDLGQRVRENTEPTLATFSDSKVAVERDERGVLPLGKDDDAKFLTVPEATDNLKYIANIAEKMQIKMGINDAVLGKMKSNISALAMSYYFAPMLDKISKKRIYWDKAFRELNTAILTYKFKQGNFRTDPFYQSAMAVDESEKVKNTILMLQNKLISYVDAIDELRSVENSTEKIAEIKKEISELSNIENFLAPKKSDPSKIEID